MTGRNRWHWGILAAIFLLLFLFLNATAPFLPWSGDDWRYLSQYRPPYPSLAHWNPARVFPEVLQPLLGLASASLVRPLTGTYPDAVRITACITATVCICCLAWAVRQLLRAMTGRDSVALFGMLLFVAFAFFLFKNRNEGNIYLFYASSVTALCYYLIPNIANAVLALGLLSAHFYGWPRLRGRWPLQGCLVLFTLCALFSMTTASLISATCAATLVLVRLLGSPGTGLRQKIASRIRNATGLDYYLFFILGCWFAAALLDMSGARYASFAPDAFHWAAAFGHARLLLADMRFLAIIVTVAAAGAAILHAGWKLRHMRGLRPQERERERERESLPSSLPGSLFLRAALPYRRLLHSGPDIAIICRLYSLHVRLFLLSDHAPRCERGLAAARVRPFLACRAAFALLLPDRKHTLRQTVADCTDRGAAAHCAGMDQRGAKAGCRRG